MGLPRQGMRDWADNDNAGGSAKAGSERHKYGVKVGHMCGKALEAAGIGAETEAKMLTG